MIRTHTGHVSWRGLRALLPLLAVATLAAADDSTPGSDPTHGPAASATVEPALASGYDASSPAESRAAEPHAAEATAGPVAAPEAMEPVVVEPASTAPEPSLPSSLPPVVPAPELPAPVTDGRVSGATPPSPADVEAPAMPEPALEPDSVEPEALRTLAQRDVAALGPLSIGTPDAGLLVNPRPMPEGPLWTIRNPLETWGTQETIDFVTAAIETVARRFPGSPRVVIGDISRPDGGRLNRHKSHQVGRDVDVGFYYSSGEAGNFRIIQASSRSRRRVAAPQLDLPRTWALMRAFLTGTDVDRIFLDRSLIAVLYRYARDEEHEDAAWLADVFGHGERKGIVQHERRHRDHMHVRFFNRVAQERGRIVYPLLVEQGVVGPPLVRHRVRRGETVGHLAQAYGSSVAAIRAANHLRGNLLRAGRSYLVPVRKVRGESEPVVVPPRRLPPPSAPQAAAEPAGTPTVAAGGGGGD
jgi:murein endopeptidase